MLTKAFSLIELMVVIAIIGILAAVGAPSYRNYIIRSKTAEAVSTAAVVLKDMAAKYESGDALPQPYIYNGNSLTHNAFTTVALGSITAVYWSDLTGSANVSIRFLGKVTGLSGIPSYVDPGPTGTGNSYSYLNTGYILRNGVWQFYCGTWNTTITEDIPLEYTTCTCSNLSAVINSHDVSSCTN